MNQDWRPSADADTLRARANLLRDIREFFQQREVLEVETPALSQAGATDPNIYSMQLSQVNGPDLYLHTSPEFPMKRLLCAGIGDIYQISKVFRRAEAGRNHNPEFTLLEWYRLGFDHYALMKEIDTLLHALASGKMALQASRYLTYSEAIQQVLHTNLRELDASTIREKLQSAGVAVPELPVHDRDPWLDLLMASLIAPSFDKDRFTFLYDYPASQASLAKIHPHNPEFAARFEVFYGELEIANGFHELQDADEQRGRFQADNDKRRKLSLPQIPLDKLLIDALNSGLPSCAGVALGVDRLLMALLQKPTIQEVISFDISRA